MSLTIYMRHETPYCSFSNRSLTHKIMTKISLYAVISHNNQDPNILSLFWVLEAYLI